MVVGNTVEKTNKTFTQKYFYSFVTKYDIPLDIQQTEIINY